MRVQLDPVQAGGYLQAGWVLQAVGTQNFVTTDVPNFIMRSTSYQGTYSLKSSTGNSSLDIRSPAMTHNVKEYYVKIRFRIGEPTALWLLRGYDTTGNLIFNMGRGSGNATFGINDGVNGQLTIPGMPEDYWFLLEVYVRMDATSAIWTIKKDGVVLDTYSGISYVGDGNGVAVWGIGPANNTAWFSDFAVNAPSLRYDTGTAGSAPAAGEVLTGGTSGAEITVTAFVTGNATAGTILGHDWNDIDFIDGEPLTSSATLVAQVDAPNADFVSGFEPNSLWCGNGYTMRFEPTGDGNSSQLTNSAATKVNNWSYVDDIGGADFVQALVANERDTYAITVAANIPAVADCEIPNLSQHAYVLGLLPGISGVSLVTRYSGTDYDGPSITLPTVTRSGVSQSLDTRPDNLDTVWDATSAAATEPGTVFVT